MLSRSSLRHTHHPIQWVMGGHSTGTKQARYAADHAHQRKAGTCCHQNAAARAEMVSVKEVFALLMNKQV